MHLSSQKDPSRWSQILSQSQGGYYWIYVRCKGSPFNRRPHRITIAIIMRWIMIMRWITIIQRMKHLCQ